MRSLDIILSALEDAHQLSRVKSLERHLKVLSVLGFSRPTYTGLIGSRYISLGSVSNRSYYRRFFAYFRLFWFLLRKKELNTTYYIFGLDILLIYKIVELLTSRRSKVVYEIADIRGALFANNLFGKVIRFIDRRIVSKVDLLVVTSEGYLKYYRDRRCKMPDSLVMENKVHTSLMKGISEGSSNMKNRKGNTKITIGYFGLLRCSRSLEILTKLASLRPDINVELRGLFLKDTVRYQQVIEGIKNIRYYGSYRSPYDLESIYASVDICWIAYPFSIHADGNWKYARTNRFYESGFFKKPMIALEGTRDACKVREKKFGIVVNMNSSEKAVSYLSNELEVDKIDRWKKNLDNAPSEMFEVTSDYQLLANKITCL